MDDFYWELVLKDGRTIPVRPNLVQRVRQKWDNREVLHFRAESVRPEDIKDFRRTSRPYSDQQLLEAASQAFKQPIINDDGSIASRWVKKLVTPQEYRNQYAGLASYRKLPDQDGMVVVAFCQPTHLIGGQQLAYCTDEEVSMLTKG